MTRIMRLVFISLVGTIVNLCIKILYYNALGKRDILPRELKKYWLANFQSVVPVVLGLKITGKQNLYLYNERSCTRLRPINIFIVTEEIYFMNGGKLNKCILSVLVSPLVDVF